MSKIILKICSTHYCCIYLDNIITKKFSSSESFGSLWMVNSVWLAANRLSFRFSTGKAAPTQILPSCDKIISDKSLQEKLSSGLIPIVLCRKGSKLRQRIRHILTFIWIIIRVNISLLLSLPHCIMLMTFRISDMPTRQWQPMRSPDGNDFSTEMSC